MAVVQLVSEDGAFNEGFEDFVQRNRIHQAGTDYQIVAITGPQSSGKSTLMNTVVRSSTQLDVDNQILVFNCKCRSDTIQEHIPLCLSGSFAIYHFRTDIWM